MKQKNDVNKKENVNDEWTRIHSTHNTRSVGHQSQTTVFSYPPFFASFFSCITLHL